ncbi:N6-adenosine-methyltransferase subunit mettl3 [Cichlidogyrus casuarinus]|uniref:mRNA m(6)A methyltransferase n=1 Tax=Cichlidogyrus casuarinus TaxID=1844966 RepID=A0ABD2PM72_9PLAT
MTKTKELENINIGNNSVEELLSLKTVNEKQRLAEQKEIEDLLSIPTSKEKRLIEQFRSLEGSAVKQFCPHGTRTECNKRRILSRSSTPFTEMICQKLHFIRIIQPHTDESLGDCSFLNTCFHTDICKYVHYKIDEQDLTVLNYKTQLNKTRDDICMFPGQWINCDVRKLDMSILGKFAVIMADPPWDIHMELPYGTMSDNEMRALDIPILQDDGFIFLWVTGRAMELGRECLKLWGYRRVEEIIWVKTNQLQRLIRTGRTGHWLNHGKEHCLVGVKGNPDTCNAGIDCDVIVSEVRETSHKPDEIYGIIERLSPGTRKLEMFGRPHNIQPNWLTLGNQLDGISLADPLIISRFRKRYPNGLSKK